MKIKICLAVFIAFFMVSGPLHAQKQLTVVTATEDLAAIAREVGGDHVTVDSIAKGYQDPHFVEAKPSFLLKLRRADLLIVVGLELDGGHESVHHRPADRRHDTSHLPRHAEQRRYAQHPCHVHPDRRPRAQYHLHCDYNVTDHRCRRASALESRRSLLYDRVGERLDDLDARAASSLVRFQ